MLCHSDHVTSLFETLQWFPFTYGKIPQMSAGVILNILNNHCGIRMDTGVELENRLQVPDSVIILSL